MKKISILALAALLVVAFTLPASAVENIFGGYWRTRMYSQMDFSGDDTEDQDLQQVDTRTRLYYTAKFSDNLMFVNKFEFDAVWGGESAGYGDIGADGIKVEVKNSYVDAKLSDMVRAAVGVQPYILAKGFIFDDDGAGIKLDLAAGTANIPIWWIKFNEGGMGNDANDYDWDMLVLYPQFKLAEGMTLRPHVSYLYANTASVVDADGVVLDETDVNLWTLGLEFDGKMGPAGVSFTGIYQGGEFQTDTYNASADVSAYLLNAAGTMDFGPVTGKLEFIYASGDDDDDDDIESYVIIPGTCHYWSEIMGEGLFDNQRANGTTGTDITNLMAFNAGVSTKVMDKVKLSFDVWYALLAEENEFGDDEVGWEFDFMASMPIVDNLNLDLVAAYLSAGDDTIVGDEDPIEIGARLSLAF